MMQANHNEVTSTLKQVLDNQEVTSQRLDKIEAKLNPSEDRSEAVKLLNQATAPVTVKSRFMSPKEIKEEVKQILNKVILNPSTDFLTEEAKQTYSENMDERAGEFTNAILQSDVSSLNKLIKNEQQLIREVRNDSYMARSTSAPVSSTLRSDLQELFLSQKIR